jgi:hypothetical protein
MQEAKVRAKRRGRSEARRRRAVLETAANHSLCSVTTNFITRKEHVVNACSAEVLSEIGANASAKFLSHFESDKTN